VTGRRQIDAYVRLMAEHPELIPADRFEYAFDRGNKVRCTVCHRDGYGFVGMPDLATARDVRGRIRWYAYYPWSPWQVPCLMDHTWPCTCGRSYTSFNSLWRHIGADRPTGWGRQESHAYALTSSWPRQEVSA
jgi:hypothetical protein